MMEFDEFDMFETTIETAGECVSCHTAYKDRIMRSMPLNRTMLHTNMITKRDITYMIATVHKRSHSILYNAITQLHNTISLS